MKTEHDSFLAFYLTQTDEAAVAFKETRFGLAPYEVPENEEVGLLALDFQLFAYVYAGNNLPLRAGL